MSAPGDLIDFSIIEGQKENIQALPSGRSARALANLYSVSPLQPQLTPTPSDTTNLNDATRREYEAELALISESDDPLDIFERYVRWTMDAYPAAQATKESQLLPLLERATKAFLTSSQYKNDPRYLKLWLSYIRLFSDSPRETFAFLARHNVGECLALYYEEFAAWLEGAGRWNQAEEVYQLGIQKEARPAARLARKYSEFQQRYAQQPQSTGGPGSPAMPPVRAALAAKADPFTAASESSSDPQAARPSAGVGGTSKTKTGKPKMQIFSDADDAPAPALVPGSGGKGWDSIGSLAERRKENIIEPKPWAGETLKAGGKKSSAPKMAVFKDQSIPQMINPQIIQPQKEQVTVNPKSGRHERILVNLEAVYPTPSDLGTEMSFEELRASARGWLSMTWGPEKPILSHPSPPAEKLEVFEEVVAPTVLKTAKMQIFREGESEPARPKSQKIPIFSGTEEIVEEKVDGNGEAKLAMIRDAPMFDENGAVKEGGNGHRSRKLKTIEVNETQIIKTKLSSPSGKKLKRKATAEPTMTFHTKAATDEIYDLFNQPLESQVDDEEQEASDEDEDDEGDETDGDYTSGGESTGTGRLQGTSEAGDDDEHDEAGDDDETSDARSVSEWSDFTARKHIPGMDEDEDEDGRQAAGEYDDTQATRLTEDADDSDDSDDEMDQLPARIDTNVESVPEAIVTPVYPDQDVNAKTTYVPIPPENYVAPTHPYRNASQISQNRLPFMTPIAEKTESSLGQNTCREEKDYFNSKTPSKENGPRSAFRSSDELMSSPFQEIINDSRQQRIAPPALSRSTKNNQSSPPKKSVLGASSSKEITQKGPIIKDAQCNPVDDYTRNLIFEALQPPLTTYEGFFDHSDEVLGKAAEIRKFTKAVSKMSKNNGDKTTTNITMPPVLRFPGTSNEYVVKRELGSGAFAPVYLLENENEETESGDVAVMGKGPFSTFNRRPLEALKMEDPPTAWEFYIMRQAKRRLGVSRAAESIIDVYEMHLYKDECYLIEEFREQGTLLDLVNIARADTSMAGGVIDEVMVMFLAIELFRTVEALHSKGLLHGDLKADNCLVRFDSVDDSDVWNSRYCRDGSGGWSKKGVSLIDFGRGIDMKAFLPNVQFIADWKTSAQDCAEMRELRPWTYQIDYHGLAGIIHSLLFGKYIDTVADKGAGLGSGASKTYKIRESLKRYWQTEIWFEVFDLLLNPLMHLEGEDGTKLPALKGMKSVREKMEVWVEGNCDRGIGLQAGIRKLEYTLQQRKK